MKWHITVEGEHIVAVNTRADGEDVPDMAGYTVLSSLIDMHIHGCAGHDMGEATPEALEAMSRCLL